MGKRVGYLCVSAGLLLISSCSYYADVRKARAEAEIARAEAEEEARAHEASSRAEAENEAPVRAAEGKEADPIAALAGVWKVTYTNDAERLYLIQKDGKVIGTAGKEKLKGRLQRKGKNVLLFFDTEDKVERLTPGADGRLFIEHYKQKADYPDRKPAHIGIGVRQK